MRHAHKLLVSFLGLTVAIGTSAEATIVPLLAQNSKSTINVEDVSGKRNKVDGDIDNEITNPKLRTESGSKSRFSGSAAMTYRGGAVSRPFGTERPNLSVLPENQTDTSLDGTLKMRYRPSPNNSFTLGVGLGLRTPFQGDTNSNTNQLNVGDPILGYNYTWAGLGLQNSANIYASYGTSKESVRMDQVASFALDHSVMKPIVGRFQLGLTSYVYQSLYDNKPGENPPTAIPNHSSRVDMRTSLGISISPIAEYYITDTFGIRAMFSFFRWRHLYGDRDNWALQSVQEFISLGVAWTVMRDIYLYPNVQFLPDDIRSEFTNFGVTASINVF